MAATSMRAHRRRTSRWCVVRAVAGLSAGLMVLAMVPGMASAETGPPVPTAVASATDVQLSWTSASNAESYTVLRQHVGVDDGMRTLDTTTTAGWTDSDVQIGERYRYRYQVNHSDGSTSRTSEVVEVTIPRPPPLPPPPPSPPPPSPIVDQSLKLPIFAVPPAPPRPPAQLRDDPPKKDDSKDDAPQARSNHDPPPTTSPPDATATSPRPNTTNNKDAFTVRTPDS